MCIHRWGKWLPVLGTNTGIITPKNWKRKMQYKQCQKCDKIKLREAK